MKRKRIWIGALWGGRLALFCAAATALVLLALARGYRAVAPAGAEPDARTPGKVAIIIDDFGLQRKGVKEMLDLDVKLTAAVMPFLDHSQDDASYAVAHGKEVIIHLPMQATTHDQPSHLGPRPIKVGMTAEEIAAILADAKRELPQAVGANIHMGTLACSKTDVMRPILSFLKENGMYFVDSMTSAKSVCKTVAAELDVRFLQNGAFLEHEEKTKAYVKKQLQKGMTIAKRNGRCVVIGHVGVEGGMITVNAINEMRQTFADNNVELVYVSELFDAPHS